MAITLTTNLELAKPDNTEIAKNWVTGVETLQQYNNDIIVDKTNIVVTSYTPTLTATTTPPNVGAGDRRGEYIDVQGIIIGSFIIEFTDPGVIGGSGEFGISLPAVVDNSFHSVATLLTAATGTPSCIGEGFVFDASNVSLCGSCALDVATIAGVSYARLVTGTFAAPVKTNRVFAAGMPSALGNGDKWTGSFVYKKL